MKKTVIFCITGIFIFSCGIINNSPSYDKIVDVKITNATETRIEHITVSLAYETEVNSTVDFIPVSDTKVAVLNMNHAADIDGAYTIRYSIDGVVYEKKFGYYSAGNPLSDGMEIEITDSGIRIRETD